MKSLRLRIILGVCGLLVGTALIVLFLVNRLIQVRLQEAVLNATSNTDAVLAPILYERQNRLDGDTKLIAESPGAKNIFQEDRLTANALAAGFGKLVHADSVVVTTPTDAIVAESSFTRAAGGLPPQARKGRQWRGVVFSRGSLSMVATHPIYDGPNLLGWLTCTLQIDRQVATEVGRLVKADIAIRYEGVTVAQTFERNLPRPEGGLYTLTLNGQTMIGSSFDVVFPGLPHSAEVIALIPRDELAAPFETIRNDAYWVFGVATLLAALLGAALSKNITSPIEALANAAQTIQEGAWPPPFEVKRQDELGLLLTVFNQMMSGLKENNDRLLAMVDIDPLTSIWNHRKFREKLEVALAEARDNGQLLSLVLIDLDGFDAFNRLHSGAAGDHALRQVASILSSVTNETSHCARTAGDEFMLMVTDADPVVVAEQIRSCIELQTALTASVGVARLADHTNRSDLLMLAANLAKDQAKQAGRNRVREFESFELHGSGDELRRFLQQGSYAAVRALAEAVDAKDEYTRGHSQRVAEYGRAIALAMGLDSGFVELVYVSGTLHDVGKIGVPDDVLKKEGKLTDAEFAEIKRHPELGEKIVAQIPQLRDALPGIRHHHERWDGRGYPDQISGEDIPLVARILALADTFDAMTGDRPYRKGMPATTAVAEILRNAGTQFDPSLISAFMIAIGNQALDQAA